MTSPTERRNRALAEREALRVTPEQRAERRKAGEARRAAMKEAGVTTYRSLLEHLGSKLERRP